MLTTHFGEADAFGNPGHRGIDIPAPGGTPILAAHSGTVLISGWNNSFGNQVLIDDGAGLSTRYAHMTTTAVSPGQPVTAGQVIGYVGSTGDSTGNHLHFEVSVGGGIDRPAGLCKGTMKISASNKRTPNALQVPGFVHRKSRFLTPTGMELPCYNTGIEPARSPSIKRVGGVS